jgi:hypothetical protein
MRLKVMIAVSTVFMLFFSCRSREAQTGSEEKSLATNTDLKLASEMLKTTSSLGACSWSVQSGLRPMSIMLSFKYEGSGKPLDFSEEFFNDFPGAASQVNVLYGKLGMSQPYKLIMEKIVAGTAPADKYRLSFDIKENTFVGVKIEVLNGVRWNVVRSENCN